MKKILTAIHTNDLLAAAGLGLIGYGLSMVSIPIALVTVGGLLLALAVMSALLKGKA